MLIEFSVFDTKNNESLFTIEAENIPEGRRIARNKHIVECSSKDPTYMKNLPQIYTEIVKEIR